MARGILTHCAVCGAAPSCAFYSYMLDKQHCLFKSSDAGRTPNKDRISGSKKPPPPTPHNSSLCFAIDGEAGESSVVALPVKLEPCDAFAAKQRWLYNATSHTFTAALRSSRRTMTTGCRAHEPSLPQRLQQM